MPSMPITHKIVDTLELTLGFPLMYSTSTYQNTPINSINHLFISAPHNEGVCPYYLRETTIQLYEQERKNQ